jgi:hypothetical protein
MVRTTVMLPDETHARLRRIARRRGIPLAAVIREALMEAAGAESRPKLSFIGAVSVAAVSATDTVEEPIPIPPFRTDPPTPEELEHFRRLADERASASARPC